MPHSTLDVLQKPYIRRTGCPFPTLPYRDSLQETHLQFRQLVLAWFFYALFKENFCRVQQRRVTPSTGSFHIAPRRVNTDPQILIRHLHADSMTHCKHHIRDTVAYLITLAPSVASTQKCCLVILCFYLYRTGRWTTRFSWHGDM